MIKNQNKILPKSNKRKSNIVSDMSFFLSGKYFMFFYKLRDLKINFPTSEDISLLQKYHKYDLEINEVLDKIKHYSDLLYKRISELKSNKAIKSGYQYFYINDIYDKKFVTYSQIILDLFLVAKLKATLKKKNLTRSFHLSHLNFMLIELLVIFLNFFIKFPYIRNYISIFMSFFALILISFTFYLYLSLLLPNNSPVIVTFLIFMLSSAKITKIYLFSIINCDNVKKIDPKIDTKEKIKKFVLEKRKLMKSFMQNL